MIPGGSAPEMEVSFRLGEYAKTLSGVESFCVRAFAEALEIIPATLAENAGLNPIAIVSELRLRHAAGEARGFWARGDRWLAHRGVTVQLTSDPVGDGDRFATIAEAARGVARRAVLPSGVARAPRVQFYGGFSFRSDHRAGGVWSDFPVGVFHLPAVELEGDGSGDAWLRVRALVDAFQAVR